MEETKPLFRLLRTEAFRFVIVRYNHYSLVKQLREDLSQLFPDRPGFTVDGSNLSYRSMVDAYYKAAKGFFYVENFEEVLANPEIYTGLNQRRDKLALYPIALIVFISAGTQELYARQIMEKMPDLWSFRSLLLDLEVETSQMVQIENWNQNLISEQVTTTTTTLGGSTPEEKEKELNRLLKRVSEVSDKELNLLRIAYQQIAKILEDLWRHDEAIEYYLKLEKVEIEIDDNTGLGYTYNNVGLIYQKKGEWDIALKYYLKSEVIFKEIDDLVGLGTIYNNIGRIYDNKGEWDKALGYYLKSESIRKEVGDKVGLAPTYNNIGIIYRRKGEWERAKEYFLKSETIRKEVGDIVGLVTTYFNIGTGFLDNGDRKQGNDYIILAGFIARNQGMKNELSGMAWALDPLIKELGNEKFMAEGKRLYDKIILGQ